MSDVTSKNIERDLVSCSINGQEVRVQQGTSIIEAYNQIQEDIAHYCWHPELSIAGVCRLCVVDIEGNPKLQIACNTKVQEGMVISNQSPKVLEAVKWGLEFHLINHPLDCPICDQAGECGLQDQYMQYGSYDSNMSETKVHKKKVVDLGPKIVLDAERCILCSRCVRFTTEITKTNELGIFNRGDQSEIGTLKGKPLNNNYALNTVDICPVGALTSKDFRFQQRVWYLKSVTTTCPGCSTGCSVHVYHNKEGVFRLKPNTNVQPWMCDEGRKVYRHTNSEERLLSCKTLGGLSVKNGQDKNLKSINLNEAMSIVNTELSNKEQAVSLLLTAQHTNEEYQALRRHFQDAKVFHWSNYKEESDDDGFDGLLKREDNNPNTKGFQKEFSSVEPFESYNGEGLLVAFMPENKFLYPDFEEKLKKIKSFKRVVIFSVGSFDFSDIKSDFITCLPMKSFVEKSGTYISFDKKEKKIQKGLSMVTEAVSITDFISFLEVKEGAASSPIPRIESVENEFLNRPAKEFLGKEGV